MFLGGIKSAPAQMGSTQVKAAVAGVFKILSSRKTLSNSMGMA